MHNTEFSGNFVHWRIWSHQSYEIDAITDKLLISSLSKNFSLPELKTLYYHNISSYLEIPS